MIFEHLVVGFAVVVVLPLLALALLLRGLGWASRRLGFYRRVSEVELLMDTDPAFKAAVNHLVSIREPTRQD